MLERLRQSLAWRLAWQYALVFALVAAVLFAALYWLLADALIKRDQTALELRAGELAEVYEAGGVEALSRLVHSDSTPDVRSLFVRLVSPTDVAVFVAAPPDWIETQVQRLPVPGWNGLVAEQRVSSVRVPQSALRDYTIASRALADGWRLQVGRLTDSQAVLRAPLRRTFGAVAAGGLLLSLAVGTLLAWRATRPLRAVSTTVSRILQTGDLTARVPSPDGLGELATLVRQLNTLLDRNTRHVSVLRDTLDDLAHDLRTPLTRLRGAAELALQDTGNPHDAREALAGCIDETDRLLHLLETLLDLSAAEGNALRLNRQRLDLGSLVRRAADLYQEVAEEKRIVVQLDLPVPAEASVDAIRFGQAVNNLLDNALKYTPEGGQVTLATRLVPGAVELTVADNGPGVPIAERELIFRRLYRSDTSRSQRGLGLGLSLVKAIVAAHGGTVSVSETPGGGATFIVRLPTTA